MISPTATATTTTTTISKKAPSPSPLPHPQPNKPFGSVPAPNHSKNAAKSVAPLPPTTTVPAKKPAAVPPVQPSSTKLASVPPPPANLNKVHTATVAPPKKTAAVPVAHQKPSSAVVVAVEKKVVMNAPMNRQEIEDNKFIDGPDAGDSTSSSLRGGRAKRKGIDYVEHENDEDDSAPMERADSHIKRKKIIVDNAVVTSRSLGEEHWSEDMQRSLFRNYVMRMSMNVDLPDVRAYLQAPDKVETKHDLKLHEMAVSCESRGYDAIVKHLNMRYAGVCALIKKSMNMPHIQQLLGLLETSYKMTVERGADKRPNEAFHSFLDDQPIQKDGAYVLELYPDPRKFKPQGTSRLGQVSRPNLPKKNHVVTVTFAQLKFLQVLFNVKTFGDRVTTALIELRNEWCHHYVAACDDRTLEFSLSQLALMLLKLVSEKRKSDAEDKTPGEIMIESMYKHFLHVIDNLELLCTNVIRQSGAVGDHDGNESTLQDGGVNPGGEEEEEEEEEENRDGDEPEGDETER